MRMEITEEDLLRSGDAVRRAHFSLARRPFHHEIPWNRDLGRRPGPLMLAAAAHEREPRDERYERGEA